MARDYELMYIVRPDLDDDAVKAAMDSVQSIVEANGGEVLKTTPWGKRRLAYEIDKLRDGHYVLLEVQLDGTRVKDVERSLRIHDQVFRHMVVTLDHPSEADADGAAAADTEAASPGDDSERAPQARAGGRGDDDDSDGDGAAAAVDEADTGLDDEEES
jgi:small subunit ribosomal protein S6